MNSTPPSLAGNRFDREILALALPALGALAADPLVSIVDTIFVGRLGVLPLAALGVNTSIFSMAFVVFNFLAYGTTPLVAREVGRGDREAAGRVVVQALVVAVLAGVVAVGILQAFAAPITAAMGARGELQEASLSYLRIRAFAGPAVLLVTAGHGAFRGFLDTRTPLLVTLGLNLVNLVLDPLFIFGFGWGLEGAAIATLIAQWVGALWFVDLLLRRRREALGVSLRLPAMTDLLPFLRVGGELIVRTFALIGTLTLATAVATRVGMIAVAAHQVGSQLWLLLALVVDSLAVAAQAMVARYRGSGDAAGVTGSLRPPARMGARYRDLPVPAVLGSGARTPSPVHRPARGAGESPRNLSVYRSHAAFERAGVRVGRDLSRTRRIQIRGGADGAVRASREYRAHTGDPARLGFAGRVVGDRDADGCQGCNAGNSVLETRHRVDNSPTGRHEMADQEGAGGTRQITINANDELARGRYSNNMLVAHTREEFIIDWLMTAPNGSSLVSRIVVSPGHCKRVMAALADNLRKYERQFGDIAPAGAIDPEQQNFH